MLQTIRLLLNKPEVTDDVDLTIDKLSENFQIIDDHYDEIIPSLSSKLTIGNTYQAGKKYWNENPTIGGYVGWVNTRDGVYAPAWIQKTTYSVGDLIVPTNDNGHYYTCITGGTSGKTEPLFPISSGDVVSDIEGNTQWTASYVYSLNDIVVATSGDTSYYYECIEAGTSNTTEPVWNNAEGQLINDGTVIWQVYKTVQWKEAGTSANFMAFSQISDIPKTYVYTQDVAQNVWTITHNLGKYPQVTVVDGTNDVLFGEVKYINDNQVQITFSMAITGKAYLNS